MVVHQLAAPPHPTTSRPHPTIPRPDGLPVLLVGFAADVVDREEALLSGLAPRVDIRAALLGPADPVDAGSAAVVVVAVGPAAVGDDRRLLRLLRTRPGAPVVVVAERDDEEAVLDALRQHAAGYLLADTSGPELLSALIQAAAGHVVVDIRIGGRIASGLALGAPYPLAQLDGWDLRPREREVLEALLEGRRNREIAEHLILGEETVKTYLRGVYRKLGARDRAQAVAIALRGR